MSSAIVAYFVLSAVDLSMWTEISGLYTCNLQACCGSLMLGRYVAEKCSLYETAKQAKICGTFVKIPCRDDRSRCYM